MISLSETIPMDYLSYNYIYQTFKLYQIKEII